MGECSMVSIERLPRTKAPVKANRGCGVLWMRTYSRGCAVILINRRVALRAAQDLPASCCQQSPCGSDQGGPNSRGRGKVELAS